MPRSLTARLLLWLAAIFVLTAHVATFATAFPATGHSQSRPSGESSTPYDRHGQARGNPTQETDPLGRSTRSQWSPAQVSVLTSTTDADGASWKYHCDDSGNLTQEIDPLGNTTAYANDERGLPTVITDAHGGRKQLQWDRRGLLVQYTD